MANVSPKNPLPRVPLPFQSGGIPRQYNYFSAPPWLTDSVVDLRRGAGGAYFELDYDDPGGWAASTFAPDIRDYIEAENRNVSFSPFTSAPAAAVTQPEPLEIYSIPASPFAPGSTIIPPALGSMNPDVYTNYPKASDMEYFTQPQVGNLRAAEVEPLVSGEQPSTVPVDPTNMTPQLTWTGNISQEGPEYWTNPDTGQVLDIESELGPEYFSGLSRRDQPAENRGFFSWLTSPFTKSRDISQVPAFGSGAAAIANLGIPLATMAMPYSAPFTLGTKALSGLLGRFGSEDDESPGFGPASLRNYLKGGGQIKSMAIGPNMSWLGIPEIDGGGYYLDNSAIDMSQLGGGETSAGRNINVKTSSEGWQPAKYHVYPSGVASITSDWLPEYGEPGVAYGDIYYGGADYEAVDVAGDEGGGEEWDAYWGDW